MPDLFFETLRSQKNILGPLVLTNITPVFHSRRDILRK